MLDQEIKIEIPDAQEKVWKSCCIELDPEFTQFFIKYAILIGLMVFSAVELSRATECTDRNMFQSLLTLMIGIALPNPKLK